MSNPRTATSKQLTFDTTTKPPKATETRDTTPTPRVSKPNNRMRPKPIHTATTDKPIPKAATPRVQNTQTLKETNPAQREMREQVRKHIEAKTMARIPQRSMYTRRTTRNIEWAQIIHDKETNTYLNYRQLLRHPKYKEAWENQQQMNLDG